MKATRRQLFAGALAVPTVAGLASWRWKHGEDSVLLFDAELAAGRRFADAGRASGGRPVAITGDRIRLACEVLDKRPALIAGVSRHADALMIEDAAREVGYVRATELSGRHGRCVGADCLSGWHAVGRMVRGAGNAWAEAFAGWAVAPHQPMMAASGRPARDAGLVLGWVLVQRG